jgi:class 3 adenylate cyclase
MEYERIHARTGGWYPAINAATLEMIAGDADRSADLAAKALRACDLHPAQDAQGAYYLAATRLEAALLLSDLELAEHSREEVRALAPRDPLALATTLKQLRWVCAERGISDALLAPLQPGSVIHYTGHRFSFPNADHEARLASRIAELLETRRVAQGVGSLASGSDILFAEALLARGAALHVVLPFAGEEFVQSSVAPEGPGWVRRFAQCLDRAQSVTCATQGAAGTDDLLFAYAGRLAMGLAVLRGNHLQAEVRQMAVWDGEPARGGAGTGLDVATWRGLQRPLDILDPGPLPRPRAVAAQASHPPRQVCAMLFGDVRGFSKLGDLQVPRFLTQVMGGLAVALEGEEILHRNTWGDGIYLVLPDAGRAARCALRLRDAMRGLLRADTGLPETLGLRLAGHVGPVFECFDPILQSTVFCGSHVTRTARLEPVTPEGEVFVSEPFAAALVLEAPDMRCEYVGEMPAAKGYGMLRMYHLLGE